MTTGYSDSTAARSGSNGMAIAGLVCGIVGIFILNVILGPLALVFGGVGLRNARSTDGRTGMAVSAIVLGVVDILLFVVLLALATSHGGFHWYVG
jgi:Domain of unknown function (DUF4190)